jgi:DnaJ like chaperone protein
VSRFIPWIGGAVGWALGGPIGGVLGFAFGKMFTDTSLSVDTSSGGPRKRRPASGDTRPGDFAAALLVLSAAVMRADNRVMKSELGYVREFLVRNYGPAQAESLVLALRELLDRPIEVREVAEQVRHHMEHAKRLLLLQYLYGIAAADGDIDPRELDEVRRIAGYLGISSRDRDSIEARFRGSGGGRPADLASAYTVLELDAACSDADIKKAYRRLAVKFHPDKVQDLGPEHVEAAQAQFVAVQQAYEQLKAARGFK